MSQAIEIGADFAAVMQELSAQAGAPSREEEPRAPAETTPGFTDLLSAVQLLGRRIEGLENSITKKFEEFESAHSAAADFAQQFQKLDEQLAAIRNSETVNQQLFDSLHQELKGYRDNFARDSLQKPFIRDLLVLFDDLSAIAGQIEKTAAGEESSSTNSQSSDNLGNMLHFLMEILHRLEVSEIETKEMVDRTLHRVISYEPADRVEDDGRIVTRVRRGFVWRGCVLRPEEVVAKRFQ